MQDPDDRIRLLGNTIPKERLVGKGKPTASGPLLHPAPWETPSVLAEILFTHLHTLLTCEIEKTVECHFPSSSSICTLAIILITPVPL